MWNISLDRTQIGCSKAVEFIPSDVAGWKVVDAVGVIAMGHGDVRNRRYREEGKRVVRVIRRMKQMRKRVRLYI